MYAARADKRKTNIRIVRLAFIDALEDLGLNLMRALPVLLLPAALSLSRFSFSSS